MNRPAQAAAAAHTFFVANPGHQEMRQNLEYYQAMAGVREGDFTDLEAKPHLVRPPCRGHPLPNAPLLRDLERLHHGCWPGKLKRCHLAGPSPEDRTPQGCH